MRWWFCLPVNPAYVLVGLLIGLVLVRMWELTDDDPSGDAPSAGSTPAYGGRERANRALAHALTVVVALVVGFVIYVGPEIAINKMWPDGPEKWAGPCVPSVRPLRAGDGPSERASLTAAAALVEQLRAQGAPDCPP
jgi:hypothetical protein